MPNILQLFKSISHHSIFSFPELKKLYILESIIRRVSISSYKNELVLRGGMMSRHWYQPGKWMPSDIDFMVQIPVKEGEMKEIWKEVFSIKTITDGVIFHLDSLKSEVIWAEAKDPGLRLFINAKLEEGSELFEAQIDISYADPAVPDANFRYYPTISGEAILAKMVHKETSAGWKFYGLFERKKEKWRPKDLFGLYWLLTQNDLDLSLVMDSFKETSIERGTPLGLAGRFFENKFAQSNNSQRLWRKFCREHPSFELNEDLSTILKIVKEKLQNPFLKLLEKYSDIVTIGDRGFPTIDKIEAVLLAIREREEFQVYEREGYQIVDYKMQLKYSFLPISKALHPTIASIYALRRECRGLIFDKDGYLIHRKMHKFFTIGELEESNIEQIDWSTPCRVIEKLDGSLVAPVRWHNQLKWTTRKGPSRIADQAAKFAKEATLNLQLKEKNLGYIPMIETLLESGWTPCFEWCSRQHPIVLDHPKDKLVLTVVRNNFSGHYLNYETMVEMANKYQIPVVQQIGQLSNQKEAEQFVSKVANERVGEGYILRFPDDRFYKVKNNWYLKLHQLVAEADNEIYIWQATLNRELEEMLNDVAPSLRPDIKALSIKIKNAIKVLSNWLEDYITEAEKAIKSQTQIPLEANKKFAVQFAEKIGKAKRKIAYNAWHSYSLGQPTDFHKIVVEFVWDYVQTRRRLAKMKQLLKV